MTVLGDLLRSPSVTLTAKGLRVNASNSESIRAGDTIVGVAGAPVRTLEALRRAFKGRGRGSKVRLSIVCDGAPADVEVTLAGAIGEPVATSRHAEVSITPLPGAEPSAVAMRASLLGKIP
jgi:PDZ domain-containing secreted protein